MHSIALSENEIRINPVSVAVALLLILVLVGALIVVTIAALVLRLIFGLMSKMPMVRRRNATGGALAER